jgi:putative endonuclease
MTSFPQTIKYEMTTDIHAAIAREKQLTGWLRAKKIALIDSVNPQWKDLSEEWFVSPEKSHSKNGPA